MESKQGSLIDMYSSLKAAGVADKKPYISLVLINGTPALRVKVNDPVTGKYLQDAEMAVDTPALKKQVTALQATINNLNTLITDAEALLPK
jgi:hypothetical protein